MTLTKPHQCFMRPRIFIKNRDLDNPRVQTFFLRLSLAFEFLDPGHHLIRGDDIRVEPHLKGGIRRTNLGHTGDVGFPHQF